MNVSVSAGSIAGLVGWGGGSLTGLTYTANPNLFGGLHPLGPVALTFTDKDTVIKFNGGICVNTLLNGEEKELLGKAQTNVLRLTADQDWENLHNKFLNPKGVPKGCAAVSWDKENWSNGFWKGNIRYEWLYKIGNETLVTYILYSSKAPNNVLVRMLYMDKGRKMSAGFFLDLNGQNDKYVLESPEGEKGWGFNPDKLRACANKIQCLEGEETKKASGEVKWTWERNGWGEQRFIDWSRNMKDAMNGLMGDPKIILNKFKDLMLEKGTWTQR